jgi:hypothetical protein
MLEHAVVQVWLNDQPQAWVKATVRAAEQALIAIVG